MYALKRHMSTISQKWPEKRKSPYTPMTFNSMVSKECVCPSFRFGSLGSQIYDLLDDFSLLFLLTGLSVHMVDYLVYRLDFVHPSSEFLLWTFVQRNTLRIWGLFHPQTLDTTKLLVFVQTDHINVTYVYLGWEWDIVLSDEVQLLCAMGHEWLFLWITRILMHTNK